MNEDKKEWAARHIESELCVAGKNVAYEVRCMLDACEKAVIDRVLEIVDEIDDYQVIVIGHIAYGGGKDELRRRIEELKGH